MNFLSLIEQKREGQILTAEQIREFVQKYTAGNIPDYQMAAMLMAVYFRGLNRAETTALTLAMRDSGEVLQFPRDQRPLVDKHSTGGIGDKVSLPLAPLLAALGFPGFQTWLPARQIVKQVQTVGCVICGQTDKMVPADKKLYALRDASGTVPSIPLITASILSKKLAESLDALVLDVKFGCAAFMQTRADANKLARKMIALGHECGMNTRAMLTDMNTPLGRAGGNWLEVKESVACLEGTGPADLRQLVIECAAQLLVQTGRTKSIATARERAESCMESGAPRQKWREMIVAQGADWKAYNRKLAVDSTAQTMVELKAEKAGFVSKCDAQVLGEVIRDLGGGRLSKDSIINYEVGVDRLAKPGDRIGKFGALCRVHAADATRAAAAIARLKKAFEISGRRPKITPLIAAIIK